MYLKLGYLGLEPRTIRLKAEYSTIELVTHYILLYYHETVKIRKWLLIKNYSKKIIFYFSNFKVKL